MLRGQLTRTTERKQSMTSSTGLVFFNGSVQARGMNFDMASATTSLRCGGVLDSVGYCSMKFMRSVKPSCHMPAFQAV